MKVMTLIINRKEGEVNKCPHCGAVRIRWRGKENDKAEVSDSV